MEEEGMTYVQDPHIMNLNLHPVYPNETENMGEPRPITKYEMGSTPTSPSIATPSLPSTTLSTYSNHHTSLPKH